jgi:2-(1,2-epoxy-1,2-dihydrophenyl)acetyl-CoA isomerase
MSYSKIEFSIVANVAVIRLNRPDKLNSFDVDMAMDVQSALDFCMDSDEVRAVLITGEGRGFCAGQDLAEAIAPNSAAIEEHVETKYNPIVRKIRAIEKPVIAAVNGVAAGAGANLAFCCDIVMACESAKFIQSFHQYWPHSRHWRHLFSAANCGFPSGYSINDVGRQAYSARS